ncbi:MAG: hypothetical protein NTW13_02860 [Candidatus Omnitrophica bacterium]|nr:hypothetical protein [Candidatus Omnitrophota bacterium]
MKSKSKNKLFVGVPSFRQDVNLDVDLIEEIARVFGYDKIPQTLPEVKPAVTIREKRELAAAIKNILVGLGLNETITYSLTDRACLESLGLNTESIAIMNPLSQEQEVLRPTLIPGLIRAIAYNLNQKQEHVAFFEIANVFLNNPRQPQEELMLAVALSGTKSFLLQNGLVKDEAGLLNLKGILETLLLRLGIKEFNFVASSDLAVDIYIQEEKVGYMLRLNSRAQDKFEIKNKDVFILEISLDKVLKYAKPDRKFFSPPKYPGITRDISFILKEELSVKDLLGALKDKTGALLRNLRIADYYKGKQIPSGYRGLTISCFYRSDQRTLLETEIEPIHKDICAILTTEFSAKIR